MKLNTNRIEFDEYPRHRRPWWRRVWWVLGNEAFYYIIRTFPVAGKSHWLVMRGPFGEQPTKESNVVMIVDGSVRLYYEIVAQPKTFRDAFVILSLLGAPNAEE